MNKIPIVFTFDKNIVLGGAVTIKSLIDHANPDTCYDIYVYHPNINKKSISAFNSMIEKTKHSISFQNVDESIFKGVPIDTRRGWIITFYRLLIPKLLPQYDKVIYSDVDVLFQSDMSEVYNTDLTSYEWAGVIAEKHQQNMIQHKYFKENNNSYIYWPGFMVMNTKLMRENNFISRCFDTMHEFNTRLKFRDLDVLNLTCHKIKSLPFKYVTLQSIYYLNTIQEAPEYIFLKEIYSDDELLDAKNNPAIIHYAGSPGKPWRMKRPYKNYLEYISKIPKELRKYTFRDIKKKLLSKY
ncbi:glycosyltransferase family 8 protein [Francisella sp. TX07-6608]|uniref:glycosyltransferase family 8 protein n=1 Tax=Francisella sp. TX07-6608 TaxID=573568 RepID=UPI0008F9B284|nr:glycosyltransferase family 8 protein [Francisella sp. TX07-6608]OIN83451.1 glycosyl transferase 8 family protein [Francisella sp. TX07-6608]